MEGSLQRIIAVTICRLCAAASRGRKPFARHPIERLVERARQAIEQLFDLGRADDERRATASPHRPSPSARSSLRPRRSGRRPRRRRAADRTNACSLLSATSSRPPMSPSPRASPTSGCSPSALSRAWNKGARRRRLFDDAIALINLDRLHRDRGGNRMAAIGEAMTECAELLALDEQRLIHELRDHHRRRSADRPTTAPWRPRWRAA